MDRGHGAFTGFCRLIGHSLSAAALLAPAVASGQERPGACDSPGCCRAADGAELFGRVLRAESGVPLPGATVEFLVTSPPAEGEEVRAEVETDETGTYRLCGLPTPGRVEAQAENSGATSRSVSFQLDAPQRVELSFEIRGVPTGLDSLRAAAAASRADAEPGRVVGRIIDAGTGRPVAEATVRLGPEGPTALTDDRGQFAITEAPAGQGELAIHHVAYGDQTVEVDVPSELTVNLDIELPPKVIEVEPIGVRVEATIQSRYLERRGFYDRMERGFGHFWSPEALERRNPLRTSHVLMQTPGIRIIRKCGSDGGDPEGASRWPRCIQLPANRRGCLSTVYLDGHKMKVGQGTRMGVDDIVPIASLAAIEVYTGPAGTAPEFMDSDSRCGVVVLWTKHGPGPPARSKR